MIHPQYQKHRIATIILFIFFCYQLASHGGQLTPINLPEGSTAPTRPALSFDVTPDGRYLAFNSDTFIDSGMPASTAAYRLDRTIGEVQQILPVTEGFVRNVFNISISDDGQRVALVATGNPFAVSGVPSGKAVWIRDFINDTWQLGSASNGGGLAELSMIATLNGEISHDGSKVAFSNDRDGLIDADTDGRSQVFLHDVQSLNTTLIGGELFPSDPDFFSNVPRFSRSDNAVVFISNDPALLPGITNGRTDLFIRELQTNELIKASVGPAGEEGQWNVADFAVSENADFVVYQTNAASFEVGGEPASGPYIYERATQRSSLLLSEIDGLRSVTQLGELLDNGRYLTFFGEYLPLSEPTRTSTMAWYLVDRLSGQVLRLEPSINNEHVLFFSKPHFLVQPIRAVFRSQTIANEPLSIAYEYVPTTVNLAVNINGADSITNDATTTSTYKFQVSNNSLEVAKDVLLSIQFENVILAEQPIACGEVGFTDVYNCLVGDIPPGDTASIAVEIRFSNSQSDSLSIRSQASPRSDFVSNTSATIKEKTVTITNQGTVPTPIPPTSGGTGGGGGGAINIWLVLLLAGGVCLKLLWQKNRFFTKIFTKK